MNISYKLKKDHITLRGDDLRKVLFHISDLFTSVTKLREGDL